MIRRMSIAALLATAALASPSPAQEKAKPDDAIVVTGVRLADTERALKDCIARHCPPDKDIAATLRHAENQFVAGDYKDARGTLLSSRRRNQRFAAQYPVEVSDLLRANSRVAAHLGEGDAYRVGVLDVVSALKAGLPDNDPRVMVAQLEVGDSFARLGRPQAAEDAYRAVIRRAHAAGQTNVEGYAMLRVAALLQQFAKADPGTFARPAQHALADIIDSPDPALAKFKIVAQVMKARGAVRDGDAGAVDRLVDAYRNEIRSVHPVLLFKPSIDLPQMSDRASPEFTTYGGGGIINQVSQFGTGKIATKDFDKQWIDVGFQITPDGKVADATVLRTSDQYEGSWSKPIVKAIEGRRYAPLAIDADDPGLYRVERYTFTAHWTTQLGSRIRVRDPRPMIEVLDLSVDAQPGQAKRGSS